MLRFCQGSFAPPKLEGVLHTRLLLKLERGLSALGCMLGYPELILGYILCLSWGVFWSEPTAGACVCRADFAYFIPGTLGCIKCHLRYDYGAQSCPPCNGTLTLLLLCRRFACLHAWPTDSTAVHRQPFYTYHTTCDKFHGWIRIICVQFSA